MVQEDADGVVSAIVGKESPVGAEATLQRGETSTELQGKTTDVLVVFVLFLVPLALSIEIDAFVVQSKYIQLL